MKRNIITTQAVKGNSLLFSLFLLLTLSGCGKGEDMMDGRMMMDREDMMDPQMQQDMADIRQLLTQHEKIARRVENLDTGVKTWTTSDDPLVAAAIQKHVRQMKHRMRENRPIRQMDPVFRELFKHTDKISLEYEDLPNGIVVTETSEDPQVVLLIQQHAHKAVSEFVKYGRKRAMQPTPLPEGYEE
jgi:hypothetical protein